MGLRISCPVGKGELSCSSVLHVCQGTVEVIRIKTAANLAGKREAKDSRSTTVRASCILGQKGHSSLSNNWRQKKFGYGESNPELPRSMQGLRGGNVSRYTISDVVVVFKLCHTMSGSQRCECCDATLDARFKFCARYPLCPSNASPRKSPRPLPSLHHALFHRSRQHPWSFCVASSVRDQQPRRHSFKHNLILYLHCQINEYAEVCIKPHFPGLTDRTLCIRPFYGLLSQFS